MMRIREMALWLTQRSPRSGVRPDELPGHPLRV